MIFTKRERLVSVCASYSQQHNQTGLNWINGGNTHLTKSSGANKFSTVLMHFGGIFATLLPFILFHYIFECRLSNNLDSDQVFPTTIESH